MYIPAGRYKINGTLRIPKGVTIRGDWSKPTKGSPIGGTIPMAYVGRGGSITSDPFIKMEPESGDYECSNLVPRTRSKQHCGYSPTITMGL
jgi:hypothetical protein